ncbi:MAG TPA: zf-HC2 domain-containing protein [Herpetosiphonaceae bacterium]
MTSFETNTRRLTQQEFGSCALIEDLLPLYIEGEVSPGSRDVIVEHLARCERCAGFLAGAQSVRGQFQRDQRQRVEVKAASQPARKAVIRGQKIIVGIALLGGAFLGAVSSAMILIGGRHDPIQQLVGFGLGVVGLGLLILVGRHRGAWTIGRLLGLFAAGGTGALSILVMDQGGPPPLGMFVGLGALVALWRVIWLDDSLPAAQALHAGREANPPAAN